MDNITTPQLTLWEAAKLQFLPGMASVPVYAVLAWWLAGQGLPNIFALMLTIMFVETPLSWLIMIRHVSAENNGNFSMAAAFPWMKKNPWWLYLVIGLPLILISAAMVAAIGPKIDAQIIPLLFAWVPDWFTMLPDPDVFTSMPRHLMLLMWATMLIGMILMGGITQELYSRGFLLPRMQSMGRVAPLYNALLFAVFHFIAPWAWPTFFLMVIPWAYLVWWRRSTKIGLFIHVGMLALQWLGMTMVLFGVVEMPMPQ